MLLPVLQLSYMTCTLRNIVSCTLSLYATHNNTSSLVSSTIKSISSKFLTYMYMMLGSFTTAGLQADTFRSVPITIQEFFQWPPLALRRCSHSLYEG